MKKAKYCLASVVLAMSGCGVFTSPSTAIKPAESQVTSTQKTTVRIIPPAAKENSCERDSSHSD